MIIECNKNSTLLEYMYEVIKDRSKNNIKSLLKNGVYVNDKLVTQYDYELKKGDKLRFIINKIGDISILYEDNEFIVIEKPHNMLTIATSKEKEKTVYHTLLTYLKRKNQKIFILHRLDKETSGIMIFCKNEKIRDLMQNNWKDVKRKYVAIVKGKINDSGVYKDYLDENKIHKVYISKEGKLAITKYKKIKESNRFSLVDIEIITGRKNQIRVQMAEHGNYILGDNKYSDDYKKYGRLYLHATEISFKHPIKNKIMKFVSPIPNNFDKIL